MERRKEEETLGNCRPFNFRSTRKVQQLLNKLFVSAQEIKDNMDLSRVNYVKLIQFPFIEE